jgi:hypothetical protein
MVRIYGEKVKGRQPRENAEMITFFNELRTLYPELARLATHIKNEGKRNIHQANKDKAEGLVKGFADIVIVGSPAFVCEMKSKSKTSKISPEQCEFLIAADKNGAFTCIAYGYKAALEAVKEWKNAQA